VERRMARRMIEEERPERRPSGEKRDWEFI